MSQPIRREPLSRQTAIDGDRRETMILAVDLHVWVLTDDGWRRAKRQVCGLDADRAAANLATRTPGVAVGRAGSSNNTSPPFPTLRASRYES